MQCIVLTCCTALCAAQIDAVLAAVSGSGLTLAQLAGGGSMTSEQLRDVWLKEVTTKLHISTLSDTLALILALDKLNQATQQRRTLPSEP
jgi:hypothetical protein